jgi:hypothetical protein
MTIFEAPSKDPDLQRSLADKLLDSAVIPLSGRAFSTGLRKNWSCMPALKSAACMCP